MLGGGVAIAGTEQPMGQRWGRLSASEACLGHPLGRRSARRPRPYSFSDQGTEYSDIEATAPHPGSRCANEQWKPLGGLVKAAANARDNVVCGGEMGDLVACTAVKQLRG